MKFKIGATIPTTQYGNIMPELEVEAETFEEAQQQALPHIEQLWARYAEPGRELRPKTAQGQKLTAFVGGEIFYDPIAHKYTNEHGDVYLSGSAYASQFEKPFNAEMIAGALAKKFKVDPSAVVEMWQLKGQVSRDFGTALHGALELYGKHKELALAMEKETHICDQVDMNKAVISFYEQFGDETAVQEALVVDHATKRAGQIDRLVITGDRKCIIDDYKTNADITKKLDVYWKQLSFYAAIMQAGGWEVEKLRIHHWFGEWKSYEHEVIEMEEM